MRSARHLQTILPALLLAGAAAFAQNAPMEPQLTPLPHPELPPPAVPGAPVSHGWPAVFAAFAAVLLGAVLFMLFRKRAQQPAPGLPPLKLARRRLLALLDEVQNLMPAEVAHRVSVIMRDFQLARYHVPAPCRTREELYDQREFAADKDRLERYATVALSSDQIAFATAPATRAEAETLVRAAIEVLRGEAYHGGGAPAAPDLSHPGP